MKVLIVGSVAYDTVETAAGRVERALGGAATYAAVAASIFCEPAVVGVVGDDFREEDLRFLQSRGIDLTGLQRRPGKTFHWAGRYHSDMIGRETLDTQLNVFADFEPELPSSCRRLEYLFLANIHPALQRRVLDQMEQPRLVLLDTMNLWINTARAELEELFPRVDVLVVNDEEARLLTGEFNLISAGRRLLERVKQAVIVKRGEHGSTLFTREGLAVVPAYPVEKLVDPTGAGDSYAGAILGCLAAAGKCNRRELYRALLMASAVASLTVEDFSLHRLRELNRTEVEQRVSALQRLVHPE